MGTFHWPRAYHIKGRLVDSHTNNIMLEKEKLLQNLKKKVYRGSVIHYRLSQHHLCTSYYSSLNEK